jgi:hypothetical protein
MREERTGTSPWVWVGCGCAVLVGLVMAAVVALGWWGYRQGKEIEAGFKDPVKRAERTREVLPYDELPPGYHPLGAISIPFFMDMVMFSDREPRPEVEEGRPFDQRGFFFIKVRQFGKGDEDIEKFLKGEGEEPPGLEGTQLDFESRETVATGTVEAGGGKLRYQARRGSLRAEQGDAEGIANFFLVECAKDDGRLRFGIWFGPEANPTVPAAEADFTGTPADPQALREFAGHFRFCA